MTTMQRLNQELDSLDNLRGGGQAPPPAGQNLQPGTVYTQQVTTTQTFYGSQPKKYAPVIAPKPRGPGQNALPPSGSKGVPPPTMPKPSGYYKPTTNTKGLPSYAPVPFNSEDLPPPPAPDAAYGGSNDPLPPPPPELAGSGPKSTPTMQTYNEPHPAVQPGYRQPAYRQPSNPTPTPAPAPAPKPVAAYHVPKPTDQPISAPAKSGAEAEIDALTNLLVANMGNTDEPEGEFFGICARCGMKVVGENNGCTAMEQVYHVNCFTCQNNCGAKLRGQPFYAVEGKAFCENCYVNSLEKCSTCSKPITDRILRATGKPYHPECFTCVVCGKSLDGVPFTVDATNQIHCIEDFHRKFAPRCSVCLQPIMPEDGQEETVRIVALDRSFHVQCYKCEDCGVRLSSEADGSGCYPLDDHILCRQCNGRRVQSISA